MQKLPKSIVFALALIFLGYLAFLGFNFIAIQRTLGAKESRPIKVLSDEESISETGYLFSMRRDNDLHKGELNLVWFVSIPSTGERWSCAYEAGFSKFKQGDGVQLVHQRNASETSDFSGYLIGLHEGERGKIAEVWAVDLDDLEMDDGR